MASTTGTIRREGLTVLKQSPDDVADLVFVHGLNGGAASTWTSSPANGSVFCWIANLPPTLDRVRTMTFGYDAKFHDGSRNLMGVRQHAETLLLHLRNKRSGPISRRPLIFVCHSLGGLVVKQALVSSSIKENYEAIHQATKTIFFFGTPHRGARLLESNTKVKLLENLAKSASYNIPSNLRTVLAPRSEELFSINDDFSNVKGHIAIVNFCEAKTTGGLSSLVVERDSAIMHHPGEDNIFLMRNHQELVRYESSDDDTYHLVVETLAEKLSELMQNESTDEEQHLKNFKSDYVKSLNFDGSEERLTEILNPNQRTFGWLWEDDIGLGQWVEEDGGIFWVTGKPGSGKSTLMKEINSQLPKIFAKDAMIIPFFFNNQGTPLQKSITGLLRHFSAEILQETSEVPDAVLQACQKKASSCPSDEIKWQSNELKKILLALLQSSHSFMHMVFLVDALDECEDMSVMGLFTLFKEMIECCPKGAIKICVSSRQMPLSLEVGGKYPGLCLQDKTLQDISNYAEDKLIDLHLEEEHDLLEEMKSEIIRKADGIFLWVELIMKVLQHAIEAGDTYSSYKKLLTQLPSKLSELYHQILMKVDAKFSEERDKLFGIILCSRRPMSVAEIRVATALGSDIIFESHQNFKKSRTVVQDDTTMIKIIKSRCGGLLETRKKNDLSIVQFIHQSVKDFLVDENEKPNSEIFGDSRLFMLGHTILSKACIRYCILPGLESLPESLRYLVGSDLEQEMEKIGRRYPFLEYAINFWPEHCGDAERIGLAQTNEITRFEGPGARAFDNWLELYNQYAVVGKLADNTSLLSLAVIFDLKDLARQQISQGVSVNTPVRKFGTYLHVAAMAGLTDMITLLIENGATVNAVGGMFHTALQAAAYSGNKESVAALLDAGADISIRGGRHPDALSAAACEGHNNIVDLLLEKLDEVTDVGGYANEALREATLTGRNTIVRTLLSRGVDTMVWDEAGINILTWAIVSSSLSTVTEFIESGMDIATRVLPGFTLLHWVSLNGREESVNLLLEKSADVNARDFHGSTPLHWAASNQRNEVLEILMSHGADPSLPNNHGITPLHFAAGQAGISQVQSLLDGGADLNDLDVMNFSIVHYAALNSSSEVLDSLVDSGLNITSQDFLGRRPVHIAAEFGQLASVKLLSRVVTILELRDLDGRTTLHAAARNTCEHVLQYCLETGSNVASVDRVGMTAIHHVFAPQGELPRLAYLPNYIREAHQDIEDYKKQSRPKGGRRKRGVDPWAPKELSEDDKNALVATAKIKFLLQYGADVDAQDENGNTALHLACSKGNISAIKLLLSKNANRQLRDFRGSLPEDTARTDEARELVLS